MEAVFRDDVSGKEASHEVSETATAGELLQEACRLFGREELDSALEVDGAVVCTGVVGGVSGGEASVGSLGVHSDSRLVLCRSRDRVLAEVAGWDCWDELNMSIAEECLPAWAWDDEVVVLAAVRLDDNAFKYASERLRHSDSFVRDAVAQNGYVLEYASAALRAEKEVVMTAVKDHGDSLQYASDRLRADKEVVLAAVAESGSSLKFVSDELQADSEVMAAADDDCGSAGSFFYDSFFQ